MKRFRALYFILPFILISCSASTPTATKTGTNISNKGKKVTSFTVSQTDFSVNEGNEIELEGIVKYNDDSTDSSILWSSSDTNVVNIDKDGKIKALSLGSATLTGKAKEDANFKTDIKITVIKKGVSIEGKVYDLTGKLIDNVKVSAKANDKKVNWTSKPAFTKSGTFNFTNVPENTSIEITIEKDGFSVRKRIVTTMSQDNLNKFNFGGNIASEKDFAMQDEVEILSVKINGKQATSPGEIGVIVDEFLADTTEKDNINYVPDINSVVGLNNIDFSKFEVELVFSELVDKNSVETNFKVLSEISSMNAGSIHDKVRSIDPVSDIDSFTIDKNTPGSLFTWSKDSKTVVFKTDKPLFNIKEGQQIKYKIVFSKPFKDKSGKEAKSATKNPLNPTYEFNNGVAKSNSHVYSGLVVSDKYGYIRYSPTLHADYLSFSFNNDTNLFKLDSFKAVNNKSGEDLAILNFSKNISSLIKFSIVDSKEIYLDANGKITFVDNQGITKNFATLRRKYKSDKTDKGLNNYSPKGEIDLALSNGGKTLTLKLREKAFDANDIVNLTVDPSFSDSSGNKVLTDKGANKKSFTV